MTQSRRLGADRGPRRPRGATLLEALVALAIAAIAAAAWLPLRQVAGLTLQDARDRAEAADAVRTIHERTQADASGPGTVVVTSDGTRVHVERRTWADLPLVDLVHTATRDGRDGRVSHWMVAARVFAPPAAAWSALGAATPSGRPALLGPGGRPPGWPHPVLVQADPAGDRRDGRPHAPPTGSAPGPSQADDRSTPCPAVPPQPVRGGTDTTRPEASAATSAATTPTAATASPTPVPVPVPAAAACRGPDVRRPVPDPSPAHRSLLTGSLRIDAALLASPVPAAEVRAWVAGLEARVPDDTACRVEAGASTGAVFAWGCVTARGRADDAPEAWLARALAPLTVDLPAAMRLCRHVDADASEGPPSGRAGSPSPDPMAPSWRIHLRIVDARAGCPADLRPVAPP